jgi:hypothetical protein
LWIRNAIAGALAKEHGNALPRQVVYQYSTIAKLATVIFSLVSGTTDIISTQVTDAKAAELENMVSDFSASFPRHEGRMQLPSKKVFIVTGTTGGLGSHLLDKLLADTTVERVYALNRQPTSGGPTLAERHFKVFVDRGLDLPKLEAAVNSGIVQFVAADTTMSSLGVDDELYQEMASAVTHIIHNGMALTLSIVDILICICSLAGQLQLRDRDFPSSGEGNKALGRSGSSLDIRLTAKVPFHQLDFCCSQ